MVGFRRPRCTIHKKKKNKPSFLKKIFLLSLYFSSLWPPFLLSIQTFWKKPQSFFFLPIPLSLLLIYYYSATYKKNQIFLLYLSIYYWFYSFYYITILMHLKEMTITLQEQISIKFSNKNKTPYAKILST